MRNSGMLRWWPLIKQCATILVGLSVLAYMTWLGFSQLLRVATTGQLLARYGGRRSSGPSYSKIISYDDAPVDFIATCGLAIFLAGFGALIWVKLWLRARKWWNAK